MSQPAASESSQFLGYHAIFGACGARAAAAWRPKGDGGSGIYRLRWSFVRRHGINEYERFETSIGFETPPDDLVPLAQTLTGRRSEWRSEIKRPEVLKRIKLKYQPENPRGVFYLGARLRDKEREFDDALAFGEFDGLRILQLIGQVLAADTGAASQDVLNLALRVGCRSEPSVMYGDGEGRRGNN